MRIAFLDPFTLDYVIETPRMRPLGGSQSALCYLAEELARRGHDVTLMNDTTTPGRSRGVECLRINEVPAAAYADYDAVIVLNWAEAKFAARARRGMRADAPLVLWSQHSHDQPAMRDLRDPGARAHWDALVVLSDWQAKGFYRQLSVEPGRIKVLGNAISPAFENLFADPESLAARKPWPPVLCYTSTPFRGLDVLLMAFPRVRGALPGARLRVFSSMAVYGAGPDTDRFRALYDQCRATEGVEYVGSVSQTVLAEELKDATCLAYPNTFAETFCIAALEAMAAGCVVITSDLGALRDTTAGFAHLLAPPPDKPAHAERFAEFTVRALNEYRESAVAKARLAQQVETVNRSGTWRVRAKSWEAWLEALIQATRARFDEPSRLMEAAAQHYRAARFDQAEAFCQAMLAREAGHPESLHWLTLIALDAGKPERAEALAARAIQSAPAKAVLHHNHGEALRRLGRRDQALQSFRRAVELKPGYAHAHFSLGAALAEQGDLEAAIAHYRRAIEIQPDFPEALNNLGGVLLARGRTGEAIAAFREAIARRPGFADALNNLGHVLAREGRLEEGAAYLREALANAPGCAAAHNNLGTTLLAAGRLKEAKAAFERALESDPGLAVARANLGAALQEEGRLEEAITHYRRALQSDQAIRTAWINLATALSEQGRWREAREAYERASEAGAGDAARMLRACVVPPIAASREELAEVRRIVTEDLAELSARALRIDDPAAEVSSVPFYLSYQGLNDREPLQTLARLYAKACPALLYRAPHCDAPRSVESGRKIKLGFVSRRIGRHSVARVLASGLIGRLSRERFSVQVFSFPHPRNHDLADMRACADRVELLPPVLRAARERLAEARLDLLCYLDIGMDPLTYFLAFARLAPVQCATWLHPVTTGIGSVDYFVSSALFEPEGAEAHYSEHLVRLEGLQLYYERPPRPEPLKPRAALGLKEGVTQYLCPQSPYKIHPDFDALLGEILRADPHGEVVLIEGRHAEWGQALVGRLGRSIGDVAGRVRMVAGLSSEGFQHLLASADVLLDPPHWSGGITTLDALAFGAPIVTLPRALMRGRVTYGCYRQMGMLELVARDEREYAALAVRLGTDRAYREAMRARILERSAALYRNEAAVRAFEHFACAALGV
jgi:predicted O-linked N-acetylglucosamine transferase (SPINDLY family)